MADTYQAKFEALVERERRATEQLQRQQEVSAVLFLKFLSVHCCAEIEMIMQLIWLVGWLVGWLLPRVLCHAVDCRA